MSPSTLQRKGNSNKTWFYLLTFFAFATTLFLVSLNNISKATTTTSEINHQQTIKLSTDVERINNIDDEDTTNIVKKTTAQSPLRKTPTIKQTFKDSYPVDSWEEKNQKTYEQPLFTPIDWSKFANDTYTNTSSLLQTMKKAKGVYQVINWDWDGVEYKTPSCLSHDPRDHPTLLCIPVGTMILNCTDLENPCVINGRNNNTGMHVNNAHTAFTAEPQLHLKNIIFKNCQGGINRGGGLLDQGGGGAIEMHNSNVNVHYCSFIDNAAKHGGAIAVYDSSLNVYLSTFIGNHATHFGGAIACYSGSNGNVVIQYSLFVNNSAVQAVGQGGSYPFHQLIDNGVVIFVSSGSMTEHNNTYIGNFQSASGGKFTKENVGLSVLVVLAMSAVIGGAL